MKNNHIDELQNKIKYKFSDSKLLSVALTHSSYCYEHHWKYRENNERLEFLGDALLDAVIAEELYNRLKEQEEGDLSRLRASIVCEDALLRKAEDIELVECIRLGNGEEHYHAAGKKRSLVADALEAVIGAIYLDGGWEQMKKTVLELFEDIIKDAMQGKLQNDYKSALQEFMQSKGENHLEYIVEKESGPDHDKTFYVVLKNDGKIIGKGTGSSKKQAEQNAAMQGLRAEQEK